MAFVRMENTHASLIENGVSPIEQTMSTDKPFWAFFSGNMLVAVWLLGVLLAGFGLNTWQGLSVIVFGTMAGCIPPSLVATMGPRTRLSQIEASRLAMGKYGARLSAVLNWVNSIGWDAINNVPSAASLVALAAIAFLALPFWGALAAIVAVQMLAGVFGHHFTQNLAKYGGWLFFTTICIVAAMMLYHHQYSFVNPGKIPAAKDVVLGISLITVGSVGYAPYMSDYTRYLPATTPPRVVFSRVFWGAVISAVALESFGFFTADLVANQTPAGLIDALQNMAGPFAPIMLLIVGLSSIPTNAMNDTSAAYCFISTGIRLPRPVSAIVGASVGYIVAVWGAGRFAEAFENYLLFLFYWIAPWTAITLVHWFTVGRHQTEHVSSSRWTWGATIFVVTTVVTMALFSGSPLYTSPVADALGGVDIGFYVGFVVSGLWYYAVLKYQSRKA